MLQIAKEALADAIECTTNVDTLRYYNELQKSFFQEFPDSMIKNESSSSFHEVRDTRILLLIAHYIAKKENVKLPDLPVERCENMRTRISTLTEFCIRHRTSTTLIKGSLLYFFVTHPSVLFSVESTTSNLDCQISDELFPELDAYVSKTPLNKDPDNLVLGMVSHKCWRSRYITHGEALIGATHMKIPRLEHALVPYDLECGIHPYVERSYDFANADSKAIFKTFDFGGLISKNTNENNDGWLLSYTTRCFIADIHDKDDYAHYKRGVCMHSMNIEVSKTQPLENHLHDLIKRYAHLWDWFMSMSSGVDLGKCVGHIDMLWFIFKTQRAGTEKRILTPIEQDRCIRAYTSLCKYYISILKVAFYIKAYPLSSRTEDDNNKGIQTYLNATIPCMPSIRSSDIDKPTSSDKKINVVDDLPQEVVVEGRTYVLVRQEKE